MQRRRLNLSLAMLVAPLFAADLCLADGTMDACVWSYEQAQRLHRAGDVVGSRTELLTCLYPRCPRVLRSDCRRWLAEVEAATPSFVVEARDSSGRPTPIRVSLDGKPVLQAAGTPILANPGEHVFTVQTYDGWKESYQVVARAGEKGRRLQVVLPPGVPRQVWVLTGVAVAEVGIAGYFFWRGHQANQCRSPCTPGDAEAVRIANTATGISLGMAAVTLGMAGWMYWSRPKAQWTEPSRTSAPTVGLRLGGSGSMLEMSGQF